MKNVGSDVVTPAWILNNLIYQLQQVRTGHIRDDRQLKKLVKSEI